VTPNKIPKMAAQIIHVAQMIQVYSMITTKREIKINHGIRLNRSIPFFMAFEVFQAFLPECSFLFVDVFFKFVMEKSPIASIVFQVIQLSEWVKHQKCYFFIHFTSTNNVERSIGTL
jgi:hypothetical protein